MLGMQKINSLSSNCILHFYSTLRIFITINFYSSLTILFSTDILVTWLDLFVVLANQTLRYLNIN